VSENRFLRSFCAFLGAVTLVCGTQFFLLAAWDWDSTTLDVEPVAPTSATISIELSESKPAEPPAEHDVGSAPISVEGATKDEIAESETAPEVTEFSAVEYPHLSSEAPQFIEPAEQAQVALEDHPHVTAVARVGRDAPLTSADIHLPVAHRRIMGETAVHRAPILSRSANLSIAGITGEARVGDKTLLASASVNVSVARENQPLVTADARVENQIWPVLAIGSVFVPVEEQPHITAEALVGAQTPPFSASANVSAELATKDNVGSAPEPPEGGDKSADIAQMQEDGGVSGRQRQTSQPQVAVSLPQEAEATEAQRPEPSNNSSITQDTPIPATRPQDSDQVEHTIQQAGSIATAVPNPHRSSLNVPMRNGTLKPSMDQRPKLVGNPKQAPKLAAKANHHEETVELRRKQMGSPPADKSSLSLTQSQPKKRDAVIAAKQEPAPKLAVKPDQRETESSQLTPRWKPMALAPANQPSLSQSQAKKPDARGYSANIWSMLARKKPEAGQRGSTTVTFAIGPAGSLRFVRVAQSSGNARLDQLALATVRAAAPFPPPPVFKDRTAAYTIRINFR